MIWPAWKDGPWEYSYVKIPSGRGIRPEQVRRQGSSGWCVAHTGRSPASVSHKSHTESRHFQAQHWRCAALGTPCALNLVLILWSFMCVCVYPCEFMCTYRCLRRLEKGIGFPGSVVTGGCEPTCRGWEPKWVLWKRSKCFWLLSPLQPHGNTS